MVRIFGPRFVDPVRGQDFRSGTWSGVWSGLEPGPVRGTDLGSELLVSSGLLKIGPVQNFVRISLMFGKTGPIRNSQFLINIIFEIPNNYPPKADFGPRTGHK